MLTGKTLLISGVSPKEVARNLGVSIPTLYRWLPASERSLAGRFFPLRYRSAWWPGPAHCRLFGLPVAAEPRIGLRCSEN